MKSYEAALWYNADIPGERKSAKVGIVNAFMKAGVGNGVRFAPIQWETLDSESPRLKEIPSHMLKGRAMCLVGTSDVRGELEYEKGIIEDLTQSDHQKLREITKREFHKMTGEWIDDHEADVMINDLGREVIEEELA